MISDKLLKKALMYAPMSWVLIRIPEWTLLAKAPIRGKTLDVGSGDGFFASILLNLTKKKKYDTGLDFSSEEISRAIKNKVYSKTYCADIRKMPFKKASFDSAFSNGTLEHVNGINEALAEISRVLKKGGHFSFTVPSKYLGSQLFFYRLFSFLRLKSLSKKYEDNFNKIFGHLNLFDHIYWKKILKKNGLLLDTYTYYNSPLQISLHDILAWWACPAFFCKKFFGKWVMIPGLRKITTEIELPALKYFGAMKESESKGGSLFMIAQKI